jgi:hypothetical protein
MKQSRLLEIIREEITSTLRETNTIDLPGDPSKMSPKQKESAIKVARTTSKDMTLGTTKKPVEFVEGDTLNEDLLNEGPFIEGPLDFAYINGKVEKNILGKAIADATQAIESSFPDVDPDSITKIITSKKSRTAEKTPEPVKAALEKIDNAIEAQIDTFDDPDLLKNLINQKEVGTSPEEIKRINQYIEGEKMYVEKLGFPQTLRAVEKTLSGEAPVSAEPKTVTTKSKTEEPKKATLAKGDDGFDDVTYSEPKKEKETKKSEEGPKTSSSKLDKMSDNKDALLKNKKAAEAKMKELAGKIKSVEGAEKESLMDELKKVNKLKNELEAKLDKLGF